MSDLTTKAEQVLNYLVLNHTPEDRATFDQVEQGTNLHGITLSDAISELEEFPLIHVEYRLIRPRARAWEVASADVVGFDVRADAWKLAQATNDATAADEHGWVDAQSLEQETGLPVKRLNIAALWLNEYDRLDLQQWMGTRPYTFGTARATYQTRKWLLNQQEPFLNDSLAIGDVSIPLNVTALALGSLVSASGKKQADMKPRIFVSHSSKDVTFASKLVIDLKAAGADAWMDVNDLGAGNFQERIDKALADCEWFLLVFTRNALASEWVRQEVYAANRLKNQGEIRQLIFIKAGEVEHHELPPMWGVFNVFDAIDTYEDALAKTLREVGISSIATTSTPLPPSTEDPLGRKRPHRVGERRLISLGQTVRTEINDGESLLEIQHVGPQTPEELIGTALGWVSQFADLGVPDDLTATDAELTTRTVPHTAMESTGPLMWTEPECTITFRGTWKVDLDALGVPKGPPQRMH